MSPRRERETVTLRLLVEAPEGGEPAARRVRRDVRETLGTDASGRPWRVRPLLTGDPSDPESRFLEASGRVVVSPAYTLRPLAFDIARSLADAKGYEVQPDLPSSAFGPEEEPEPAEAAPDVRGWSLEAVRAREAWETAPATRTTPS